MTRQGFLTEKPTAQHLPQQRQRQALLLIPQGCPYCNGDVLFFQDGSSILWMCLQCSHFEQLPESLIKV